MVSSIVISMGEGPPDSDKQQSATYRCLARLGPRRTGAVLTRNENAHMDRDRLGNF
jgi:hypothetical protein